MGFTYTTGVPNPPNSPAVDVGPMQTNTNSIASLISVDHVGFNTAGGGKHLQVTFNSKNSPAAQVDPVSTEFTADAGTIATATGSASTVAQLFYRSANGFFPISAIKAFGNFTTVTVAGAVTPNNAFNVSAIAATIPGAGTTDSYAITLTANAVTGNNLVVFAYINSDSSLSFSHQDVRYTFTNPTLTLTVNKGTARFVNFIVLQV